MGHDDTTAYNGSPTGNGFRRPLIKRLTDGTELRLNDRTAPNGKPAVICETQGAMSQQSSEAAHSHESVPQQLLHLVGYRDPRACPAARHRPHRSRT